MRIVCCGFALHTCTDTRLVQSLLSAAYSLPASQLPCCPVTHPPPSVCSGLYMLLLCGLAVLLDKRGVTLKLW
jgi:hypothetical protein